MSSTQEDIKIKHNCQSAQIETQNTQEDIKMKHNCQRTQKEVQNSHCGPGSGRMLQTWSAAYN